MNESLQRLRELALRPACEARMKDIFALFSACTGEAWFEVAADYAGEHGLVEPADVVRLKLQSEAARLRQPWINPTDHKEMIWIPPGEFLYGFSRPTPSQFNYGRGWERPQLGGFSMARHPVTNAQYARFVEETGYRSPIKARWLRDYEEHGLEYPESAYLKHWSEGAYPPEKAEHPVVYVSWFDAQMYCRWAGLVLPTEGMWEKAARGTDGRAFPWGSRTPERDGSGLLHIGKGDTCSVREYARVRTAYGCANMMGNVSELCDLAVAPSEEASFDRFYRSDPSQMPLVRPDLSFRRRYRDWLPMRGSNYGGFVKDHTTSGLPNYTQCNFQMYRNAARHSPYCGFRPAFVPTFSRGESAIDFEGFEAYAQEEIARSRDQGGYVFGLEPRNPGALDAAIYEIVFQESGDPSSFEDFDFGDGDIPF